MRLRPYRTSIILAVTFTLVLSTFWFLPQLAFIVFISLLLQLLLRPLVDKLAPHVSRGLAAAVVLLTFIALALGRPRPSAARHCSWMRWTTSGASCRVSASRH